MRPSARKEAYTVYYLGQHFKVDVVCIFCLHSILSQGQTALILGNPQTVLALWHYVEMLHSGIPPRTQAIVLYRSMIHYRIHRVAHAH